MGEIKLHEIPGVEVFSVGTWNDDPYTQEDLDEMVVAFNENRGKIRPFLKLGHDDDQKLLQKDGYPAAGWISNLYRSGSKLIADFSDIPDKIYQLIKNKAYRKVSCEIYKGVQVGERFYDNLLGAVSLLGSDLPAVMDLDDMLALYGFKADSIKVFAKNENLVTLRTYDFPNIDHGGNEMDEKLVADLKSAQEQIKNLSEQLETFKADSAKVSEIKTQLEDSQKLIAALERTNFKNQIRAFVSELEAEGLVTKTTKSMVEDYMEDKKEYSLGDKKVTKEDLFKEILKLTKESGKVNFKEHGSDNGRKTNVVDLELDKVNKYAAEKKITFSQAYRELQVNIPLEQLPTVKAQ